MYMSNMTPHTMFIIIGTTASLKLRELGYAGRIIGITGNALQEDILDFMKHGVDRVMIKPLTSEDYNDLIIGRHVFHYNSNYSSHRCYADINNSIH
jgi:hypothetical protein